MNLKKCVTFWAFCFLFMFTTGVYSQDLKIEEGKNLKFDFRKQGENENNTWYDKTKVYDNVNIGAGTKVVLDSQWQYVFVSSSTDKTVSNREMAVEGSTVTKTVQDETYTTTYNYRNDENIATLSIAGTGTITLNSGSELSIRNQYSLLKSSQEASLEYMKNEDDDILFKQAHLSNMDNVLEYSSEEKKYTNRNLKGNLTDNGIFTGDIIFAGGDADTVLTFQPVSTEQSEDYVLPTAAQERKEEGTTSTGGDKIYIDQINDTSVGMADNSTNIAKMANNFQINSNRAVFNVVGKGDKQEGEWSVTERQVALGKLGGSTLSGTGMVVKKGEGVLNLLHEKKIQGIDYVDGSGLTGESTGYAWSIEEGMVVAHKQENLGTAGIYLDAQGTLGLSIPLEKNSPYVLEPAKVFSKIKNNTLSTNKFSNNITSSGGEISIASGSQLELSGKINTTEDNNSLRFTFYKESALFFSGENDAENFIINFGANKGGESNYLITGVDGLASNSVNVTNKTKDSLKEFAFFELVLKENEDKEYTGSLNGDMYLHKLGTGTVTLSGNNTYTEGTYITEGGLLLANSSALGTGKILFDGGVIGNTATYASIGVSSATTGDIKLANNIHVKTGAVLDVYENQNLSLLGDLVSYDTNYATEFIKNGLGEAKIAASSDESNRKINISSFTITEGGFVLDKNVVLDSYFSLNGEQAYLQMEEAAGIKNNKIDIYNGDLIIFNENNLSSATAVHFYNTSTSTESFSKFRITSDAVLSQNTLNGTIDIDKNIEFVTDSTATANLDAFNFNGGRDTVISKSGEGNFIVENGGNFDINGLYINDGIFRLDGTDMTVSGTTLIDGGILSISSTSYFSSTVDKKITVLNGGIGIFDDTSIDSETLLSFEGTDTENLSKLVVEDANVNLTNDIYVKTGVIVENEKDLTFSGDSIDYDPSTAGIFAKSGEGTMTIDSAAGTFTMGELRALEGNLVIKSDVEVSTISITGESAVMSVENESTVTVSDMLSIENNALLQVSTATINAASINLISSTMTLTNSSALINTTNVAAYSGSIVDGFGKINGLVTMKDTSSMYVGKHGTISNSSMQDIVFEKGSALYIDVESEDGQISSDKLDLTGNITVQKDVDLHVNLLGSEREYETAKSFEFITYSGEGTFENSTNEIFNIVLSNARFSASTLLLGKSIFLQIAQEWSLYDMPGATKNQQAIINILNNIYDDSAARANLETTLAKMDNLYGLYKDPAIADGTQFLNALQDLSGIFYANSFMTSAMLSKANIVYNRLNDFSVERQEENNVWVQVYANSFTVDKEEDNPKFENNIYGVMAGYDTIKIEDFVLGFAGFYGQGELKQLDDKADVIDAGANVYMSYKYEDNIEIKGLAGYSLQDYDTTRNLRFINKEIKSKYQANTLNFDLEASYKYDISKKLSLKPLIGANCAVVSNGDIEEDGDAEQKLKIDADTYAKTEVRLGVGLQSNANSVFNWYISAVAKQIVDGDKFTMTGSFVKAPGYKFEIESTKLSSTVFSGNIGCKCVISPSLNLFLDLSSDMSSSSAMFGGNVGASYKF